MILRHAQLRKESTDSGIVARLSQLVDPAGTDAKRMGCKENVLQCTGAIHACPPLCRLVGDDDQRRRMVIAAISLAMPALLQAGFVTLGKSAFDLLVQFLQHGGVLDGNEMPRL